jgi:hypothetical protein
MTIYISGIFKDSDSLQDLIAGLQPVLRIQIRIRPDSKLFTYQDPDQDPKLFYP